LRERLQSFPWWYFHVSLPRVELHHFPLPKWFTGDLVQLYTGALLNTLLLLVFGVAGPSHVLEVCMNFA
jgi:hypothetical protein